MEAHFPSDRMSARSVRHFLRAPSAHVWVVESGDHLSGSLILLTRRGGRSARIYSVIVLPEMRGQGLAARLVAEAEAEARRLNLEAVTLEVRRDNVPAQALYRKLGYVEVRTLPGFYDDGADGLRLRKAL
ncbi:MAG: GNAT family N-acetyltransferase [Nevskiaceae bacterium]|nr:MAG: GNAT family N-acetyltransferase [Nevskiaceae bacterium]